MINLVRQPSKMSIDTDSSLLDPSIFDYLKDKLDEETRVRDTLTEVIQRLERATATAQALLSRVHATPRERCKLPMLSRSLGTCC